MSLVQSLDIVEPELLLTIVVMSLRRALSNLCEIRRGRCAGLHLQGCYSWVLTLSINDKRRSNDYPLARTLRHDYKSRLKKFVGSNFSFIRRRETRLMRPRELRLEPLPVPVLALAIRDQAPPCAWRTVHGRC